MGWRYLGDRRYGAPYGAKNRYSFHVYEDQCCNLIEGSIQYILDSFSWHLDPEISKSLLSKLPDGQKGESKKKAQNTTNIRHLNIKDYFQLCVSDTLLWYLNIFLSRVANLI